MFTIIRANKFEINNESLYTTISKVTTKQTLLVT